MAFDREWVATITYCEASNASPEERRMIVHSIFNRHSLNPVRYGKTPASVCVKRYQYSELNDDVQDNANLSRATDAPDNDVILQDCLEAYEEVLDGAADISGGSTHYHDKSIKPPYWTVGATVTRVTNKFTFYKDVK